MTKTETAWRGRLSSFVHSSFDIPWTFVIRASSFLYHDHARRLFGRKRDPFRDRLRRRDATSEPHRHFDVARVDVKRGQPVARRFLAISRRCYWAAGLQRAGVRIFRYHGGGGRSGGGPCASRRAISREANDGCQRHQQFEVLTANQREL